MNSASRCTPITFQVGSRVDSTPVRRSNRKADWMASGAPPCNQIMMSASDFNPDTS